MKNIKYHSFSIESLISKKGTYKNNIIYLNEDVIMKNDGYIYTTQKLNFNQKTQILNITTNFKGTNNINHIWGDKLKYYANTKEMFATHSKAIFYTNKSSK